MLTKKRKLSLILIGLTTVFWGLGFPLTKICVDSGASPALINAIRFVGATILFGGIFFKKIHLNWRKFKYGAIGGALLFVAFLLQTTGQIYTSPTNSGFFASVSVVLIP
ncbi:MAG: EamA family transporter, partial [Clostridia bacterium]